MNTYLNDDNEILKTQNICKSFNGKTIIEDILLSLHSGEIISLLGASGIGKSTLFNVISGLLAPDKGTVILKGEDITRTSGHVSYMQQKDLLLPYKTIIDNIILPLLIKGENKRSAKTKVMKYIDMFGLTGYENKYASQLSGGMRQRAALLRTYMFSKDVNLLDEPFSALDAITKSHMHSWYLDIAYKLKMSTIFITHDIDEAIILSDRIYIMSGTPGKITALIKIDEQKPRKTDFSTSEIFIDYKKNILNILQ